MRSLSNKLVLYSCLQVLVFFSSIPFLFPEESEIQFEFPEEAAAELYSMDLDGNDVSLFLLGSWKASAELNWGLELTPLGLAVAASDSPFLFTQEADITLSLWMKERWFLEASFLDDYDINTYRTGFQGKEDDTVQYLGIGNTGLDFPSFPYLDLGGDSASSFGVYGRFGNDAMKLHGIVRYDTAQKEERSYQGDRERISSRSSPASFMQGVSFVLPDTGIDAGVQLYLEDSNGSFYSSDSFGTPDGRRWRLASNQEYAVSTRYGLIELNKPHNGMIAVIYTREGASAPWDTSLGSYGIEAVPGSAFLGAVQAAFREQGLDPGKYPQLNTELHINGKEALQIYERGLFSPFERLSRYTRSGSSITDAALIHASSGEVLRDYVLYPLSDILLYSAEPFYLHTAAADTVYELVNTAYGADRRSVQSRWPLLALMPELYIPGFGRSTEDLAVRFLGYGNSGSYDIGTDVIPGSVQVYRQGLPDPTAFYDPETGTVQLENPASFDEIIRITYLTRSDERRFGSLAAGVGFEYTPEGPLQASGALGLRWNVSEEAYSETGSSNEGSIGIGAQLLWDRDPVSAGIRGGIRYEQSDSSGLYRISGMEGSEFFLDLPASQSSVSEVPYSLLGNPEILVEIDEDNRAPLIYRDYYDTDLFGFTSLKNIEWDAPVISGENKPYPVLDSTGSTVMLSAEFTLTENASWTGFQVNLNQDADFIGQAAELLIPIQLYQFMYEHDFSIWIQLGDLSTEGSSYENTSLVVSRKLFDSTQPFSDLNQPCRLTLTRQERQRLGRSSQLRLLIINEGSGTISGRMLLAPPIVRGALFNTIVFTDADGIRNSDTEPGVIVQARELPDTSLQNAFPELLDKLHPQASSQRIMELSWSGLNAPPLDVFSPGIDTRIPGLPLSDYASLSFYVKKTAADNPDAFLRFLIDEAQTSVSAYPDTSAAIDALIPLSALIPGQWAKLSIEYGNGEQCVRINGQEVNGARIQVNRTVLNSMEMNKSLAETETSSYAAFMIVPNGSVKLTDGSIYLDELVLEDPLPRYSMQAGAYYRWEDASIKLSTPNFDIVKDLHFETRVESGMNIQQGAEPGQLYGAFSSRSGAGANVFGATLGTELGLSGTVLRYSDQLGTPGLSSETIREAAINWDAGHTVEIPAGPVQFNESFFLNPAARNLKRNNSATITLGTAFSVQNKTQLEYTLDPLHSDRFWQSGLYFQNNAAGIMEGLSSSAQVQARIVQLLPETYQGPEMYHEAWADSTKELVPDKGSNAQRRQLSGLYSLMLPFSDFSILLEADTAVRFLRSTENIKSDSTLFLSVPFNVQNLEAQIYSERDYGKSTYSLMSSFYADTHYWVDSLQGSEALFFALPVMTLADSSLPDIFTPLIQSGNDSYTDSGYFYDTLGFRLELPSARGIKALLIPSMFQSSITRRLEKNLDTYTDTLDLGGRIEYSALGLFGAFGYYACPSFFKDDEYSQLLDLSVLLSEEEPLWNLKAEQYMGFYGFLGSLLTLNNKLELTNDFYSDTLELFWTVPQKNTFLGTVYSLALDSLQIRNNSPVLSELTKSDTSILRRESLFLSIENAESYGFKLSHESIVRVDTRLELNAFCSLEITNDTINEITRFTSSAGTSLRLSY